MSTVIPDAATLPLAIDKITQSVVLVGADTATRWLEHNPRNRPILDVTVARYRRDMADGNWLFAADPIRFNSEGALLDGQHRLTAHSQVPGLTLPYLVVRGLPDETQMVMDQGRKRTPGQQLALKGIPDYNRLAAAAKLSIIWESGLMFRDNKVVSSEVTTHRIESWVDENAEAISIVQSWGNITRRNDAPGSVALAAALRFVYIDDGAAREFFQTLADGGAPLHDPITTLDKRLQRIRRDGTKMSARDYLSLFIIAWNARRDGRSMSKFQRPRGGSWTTETFPEPK